MRPPSPSTGRHSTGTRPTGSCLTWAVWQRSLIWAPRTSEARVFSRSAGMRSSWRSSASSSTSWRSASALQMRRQRSTSRSFPPRPRRKRRSWGRRWPASAGPRQLGFDSAGEAFDDRAGDAPGDARPCIAASAAVAGVDVHRLQPEPSRSGAGSDADLALADGLGQKDGHAGDETLEGAFHRLQLDVHGRLLPEQHVVLEVGRDRPAKLEPENGDELSLDVVEEVRALAVMMRGGELGGYGHAAVCL